MRRWTVAGLLALLLVGSLAPLASGADQPVLKVSASDIYLRAGQENQITLTLTNTGDYVIQSVEAFLSSTTPGLTVLEGMDTVFSRIQPDKSKSYKATLYVDQGLPLGSYSLSLTVTYVRSGYQLFGQLTVPIGVVVSQVFVPSLVYRPSPLGVEAVAGVVNELEFSFENVANGSLGEVAVVVSSPSPNLVLVDDVSLEVGDLERGGGFTVRPKVLILEGTPLGPAYLQATATYLDPQGARHHQSFNLPLSISSTRASPTTLVTIEEMKVLEPQVRPGDKFNIELKAKCTGAHAYEVLSTLTTTPGSPLSLLSPSVVDLGELGEGETAVARYTLLAGGKVEAGQYPLTATISYTTNKGTPKTVTETLTVLVDSLVEFRILDAPTLTAEPGSKQELEADLLLVGTESVDFVSVGIQDSGVVDRTPGSEEYIGAVDPDSPIPFNLVFQVEEDAPEGEHGLTLQVVYRDHLNREHVEELEVGFKVGSVTQVEEPQPRGGLWDWVRRLLGLGP